MLQSQITKMFSISVKQHTCMNLDIMKKTVYQEENTTLFSARHYNIYHYKEGINYCVVPLLALCFRI